MLPKKETGRNNPMGLVQHGLSIEDASENEDDSDAEIARRIPLYFCNKLEGRVNIFNYPYTANELQVPNVELGKVQCESGIVELVCKYETTADFYDKKNDLSSDDSKHETEETHILRGEPCLREENLSKYMLLIFDRGKAYMNNVDGYYYLNPTCSGEEEEEDKKFVPDTGENNIEKMQPVSVKFSQTKLAESKYSMEMQAKEFHDYSNKLTKLPWINTQYYTLDSPFSMRILADVRYALDIDVRSFFSLDSAQYALILAQLYKMGDKIMLKRKEARVLTWLNIQKNEENSEEKKEDGVNNQGFTFEKQLILNKLFARKKYRISFVTKEKRKSKNDVKDPEISKQTTSEIVNNNNIVVRSFNIRNRRRR